MDEKLRKCNTCKELKLISEFHKDKKSPDGIRYKCKKCNIKDSSKWAKTHKDRIRELVRTKEARRLTEDFRGNRDPEDVKRRAKESRKKYFQENKEYFRKYNLKWKYDLTTEQYNQLLNEQEYKCKVCNKLLGTGRNVHIDHDHTTGKVRSILCRKCNTALGMVNDDIAILQNLINYLKYHFVKSL
jgi:arsenate reductase-like glutaredoxin family protein